MKQILTLFALLWCLPSALADRIIAEITITNTPANGSNLVVNAATRSWITVVTTPASQIAVTNSIPNSITNLQRHLLRSQFTGVASSITATNKVTLYGFEGWPLVVTFGGNWAEVSYSTNTTTTNMMTVVVPDTSHELAVRNFMFSMVTTGLNNSATSSISPSSTFASRLVGLTNAQTVGGEKTFTNENNVFYNGLATNMLLRSLQMHHYPSNAGIYGFTSGLDPSSVLAVDANGAFSLYSVNAIMGEPLDTPQSFSPAPENIMNVLIGSNKFGGKAWGNLWTAINQFTLISNSVVGNSALTNVTIDGTYYGPITQFGTNFLKASDALSARTLLEIIPSGLTSGDFNATQFRVDGGSVSITNGAPITNLVAKGVLLLENTADSSTGVIRIDSTHRFIHKFGSSFNFFAGYDAGNFTMSGAAQDTGVGYGALAALTSGDNDTAIGTGALGSVTTGSDNTGVGNQAGDTITTGTKNTVIGASADASAGGVRQIAIGYNANNATDSTAMIGGVGVDAVILNVNAGAAAADRAHVGGVILSSTALTGNVGTGDDTLYTDTIQADTLNATGQTLEFWASGSYGATANTKNLKVKLGTSTIAETGALAINNGSWELTGRIIRTGSASQRSVVVFHSDNALLVAQVDKASTTENLTTDLAFSITGEATDDSDVSINMFKARWEPAGN